MLSAAMALQFCREFASRYRGMVHEKTEIPPKKRSLGYEATMEIFMRNLDASDWLSGPNLGSITNRKKGQDKLADFVLSVTQVDKNKPKKKDGE